MFKSNLNQLISLNEESINKTLQFMRSFNSLKSLVAKLTKVEIEVMKSNLIKSKKSILLFDLLLKNRNEKTNDIIKKIYGSQYNYSSFNKLVKRLQLQIEDVILSDQCVLSNNFTKRNEVVFNIRKKLIQVDILHLKDLRREAVDVLNNVINKCHSFELYDLLIQALNSKRRIEGFENSKVKSSNLDNEIMRINKLMFVVQESRRLHSRIINNFSLLTNEEEVLKETSQAISYLDNLKFENNTPTVDYFYFGLQHVYYSLKKDYYKADFYINQQIQILEIYESVFTPNRMGSAILNLADNLIYLNLFQESIDNCIRAKDFLQNQSLALAIVNEVIFYSLFYLKRYNECVIFLNESLHEYIKISDSILYSKTNYFLAYTYFMLNDLDRAKACLELSKDIRKDKQGFNLNLRFLRIMISLRLNDFDSAELDIGNLNKFLKRILKDKNSRNREKIICKYIIYIINNISNENIRNKPKYLNNLLTDGDSKWRLRSPELIDVANWLWQFSSKRLS